MDGGAAGEVDPIIARVPRSVALPVTFIGFAALPAWMGQTLLSSGYALAAFLVFSIATAFAGIGVALLAGNRSRVELYADRMVVVSGFSSATYRWEDVRDVKVERWDRHTANGPEMMYRQFKVHLAGRQEVFFTSTWENGEQVAACLQQGSAAADHVLDTTYEEGVWFG